MSTTQTDVANVDIISNTVDPIIPDENEQIGFSYKIVGSVAIAHLMNDLIQAVLPSIYPMLKIKYSLSFAEIGWMAMTYQP